MKSEYEFTQTWFDDNPRRTWESLIPQLSPRVVVEVGSYEGNSACFLLETAPRLSHLFCIDTWEGGIEHKSGGVAAADMSAVEKRFHHNIEVARNIRARNGFPECQVELVKSFSDSALANLFCMGLKADLVYIDGSHQAPDVLCDLVLGWRLLTPGGVLIADDYPWKEHDPADILRCPKIAIDAFTQIYFNKLNYIPAHNWQVYLQKKI